MYWCGQSCFETGLSACETLSTTISHQWTLLLLLLLLLLFFTTPLWTLHKSLSFIHSFIHSRVEFFLLQHPPRRRKYNLKGLLGAMVCLSHEKDKEYDDGGLGPFTLSCGKYVTNPWSVFSNHFDPSGSNSL